MSKDGQDTTDEQKAKDQAEERIVTDAVEKALAPYVGLLTEAELADARVFIADVLATHPVTSDLLGQLLPIPNVTRSDDRAIDGEQEGAEPARVDKASGETE